MQPNERPSYAEGLTAYEADTGELFRTVRVRLQKPAEQHGPPPRVDVRS